MTFFTLQQPAYVDSVYMTTKPAYAPDNGDVIFTLTPYSPIFSPLSLPSVSPFQFPPSAQFTIGSPTGLLSPQSAAPSYVSISPLTIPQSPQPMAQNYHSISPQPPACNFHSPSPEGVYQHQPPAFYGTGVLNAKFERPPAFHEMGAQFEQTMEASVGENSLQYDGDLQIKIEPECIEVLRSKAQFVELDFFAAREHEELVNNVKEKYADVRYINEQFSLRVQHQEHEIVQIWDITSDYADIVDKYSEMIEQQGQSTDPCHELIAKIGRNLAYAMKPTFDAQAADDFTGFAHADGLGICVQGFKIKLIYAQALISLQSHPRSCEEIQSVSINLQTDFAYWTKQCNAKKCHPARLQVFVEIAYEISELFNHEMQKDLEDQRIHALEEDCSNCLGFLKSNSFDPEGALNFEHFASKARKLKFCALIFKLLKVPKCIFGGHDSKRGATTLRMRMKRECNVEQEGFDLVKFLYHIMITEAVELKWIYARQEYKTVKKTGQRKNQGILIYVTFPTKAQAERFMKLLIAWGELESQRYAVFQRYSIELYEMEADDLNEEEEEARCLKRQALLRKSDSMAKTRVVKMKFLDQENNMVKEVKKTIEPSEQEIKDDQDKRQLLCEEENWSPEHYDWQKAMYHFGFAK